MFCSKCGAENKEDAKFCDKCGNQLKQSKEKKSKENVSQNKSLPVGAIVLAILLIISLPISLFIGLLTSTDLMFFLNILVTLIILFGIFTQKKWLPKLVKFWYGFLIILSILGLIWIFISPLLGLWVVIVPEGIRSATGLSASVNYDDAMPKALGHFLVNLPTLIDAIIFIWYFSSRKEYFYK